MTLAIIRPLTYQKCRTLFKNATALVRLKSTGDRRGNLDPGEVEKFQKLSQEWWDPNGPLKSLFTMNKLRVPFIRDGLNSTRKDDSLNKSPGRPLAGLKVGGR